MRVSLGRREDINPYATFRLPGAGADTGGSSVQGPGLSPVHRHGTLQSPQHTVCMYGSCGDAVYTKIRGKDESIAPDWIPLHSLYQERRLYQHYQQLQLELYRYEALDLDVGLDLGLESQTRSRIATARQMQVAEDLGIPSRSHTLQHGQRERPRPRWL
ncbi:hypothetical protein ONE63_005690 [Megalurothrips usitatus]|uniref:Uncharacterized protein n=1 Tax=Megalurothrips usitatus TaxID=439358 RepID=A0AAV7XXD2_9NEOP|nr:hypothetical protein ONE63_005690 [Megalurothrips usitatus]